MPDPVISAIDAYADRFPRVLADVVDVGPFRLFVGREGWRYYARPVPGASTFSVADVLAVMERQDQEGLPRAIEWIDETSPSVIDVIVAAGLSVQRRPLMAWSGTPSVHTEVRVELLDPADERYSQSRGAVFAGFENTDELLPEPWADRIAATVRAGHMAVAGAFLPDGTVIGGGSRTVAGTGSEVTGIGVLPSFRGLGAGAALAALLAEDARDCGAELIFLSAGDEPAARVYERAGFVRVGTAFAATAPT